MKILRGSGIRRGAQAGLRLRAGCEASALALVLLLLPSGAAAFAHTGPPPSPRDLWQSWSWDPLLLSSLVLSAWLYLRGLRRIWRRAGTDRGIRIWQAEAFFAGLATLFVALISPLDGISSALFAAHMLQHLLLMLVAAPLFAVSAPLTACLWAFRLPWRRRLGRLGDRVWMRRGWTGLTNPVSAWFVAVGALWAWHAPILYDAALAHAAVHAAEHACLLGAGVLFWYVVLPHRGNVQIGRAAALISLFSMAFQSVVLGIAITASRSPWYAAYRGTTAAWHLTPLQDQQIAGLIMWIPAGAFYLGAALALLAYWIASGQRETAMTTHELPTQIRNVSADDTAAERRPVGAGLLKGR